MFRELRRKKQQLSDAECVAILTKEKRGILSVMGDDGYPYGTPMNHFYNADDGCIYFHCGKGGHRADALQKCNKVSFCVYDDGEKVDEGWALTVKSVIVFGEIEAIETPEKTVEITRKLCFKFTNDLSYIEDEIKNHAHRTVLLKLTPKHVCGKRVTES